MYGILDPTWVRPEIVAEIKFNHWTNEGIMRAPIFLRFREDKRPKECTIVSEKQIEDIVPSANDAKEDDKLVQLQPTKTISRHPIKTRTIIPDTAVVKELSSSSFTSFLILAKYTGIRHQNIPNSPRGIYLITMIKLVSIFFIILKIDPYH